MKRLLVATLVCSALCAAPRAESREIYDVYTRIASTALQKHNVSLAEVMYERALEQSERFGESDSRLVSTLSCLANLYASEGEYTLAQPLYLRMIRIVDHNPGFASLVASSLEHYAELQEKNAFQGKAEVTRKLVEVLRSTNQ